MKVLVVIATAAICLLAISAGIACHRLDLDGGQSFIAGQAVGVFSVMAFQIIAALSKEPKP